MKEKASKQLYLRRGIIGKKELMSAVLVLIGQKLILIVGVVYVREIWKDAISSLTH